MYTVTVNNLFLENHEISVFFGFAFSGRRVHDSSYAAKITTYGDADRLDRALAVWSAFAPEPCRASRRAS